MGISFVWIATKHRDVDSKKVKMNREIFVINGSVSPEIEAKLFDIAVSQADWDEIDAAEAEFDAGGGESLEDAFRHKSHLKHYRARKNELRIRSQM